jgi:CCR4-NOT transcription complex subunit 2
LQIFFQMPRDINQELAATELSMRDWRWHKVIRRWLQKDTREANAGAQLPIIDLTNGAPIGQPAVRVSDRCERGVYIFFDHENWRRERKEFTLHYDELHVNTLPTAPPGVNGTGQAGGFSGMGGMSGMAGSHVGGPVNAERQNSMISGLS